MKFDDITVHLGEFGKYQRRQFVLVAFCWIFGSMQTLCPIFILSIPDHRCQIPSLTNDTYKVQGHEHQILINQSIPWVKEDGEWSVSSCDIYVTNNKTVYDGSSNPVNVSEKSCDSWVYDKSSFESTFITKVDLICGNKFARATANMIMMGGLLVGSIVFGVFSDMFGRKTALIVGIFFYIGGGLGTAFSPNYATFVSFRFIVGMANVCLLVTAFTLAIELVGSTKRVIAGVSIQYFWLTGMFVLDLVAYFVRDWKIVQLIITCPAALLLSYYWVITESPRWLLIRGKSKKAVKIFKKCAEVNKVKLPDEVIEIDTLDEGERRNVMKMFTTPRLVIRTLIIWFNWLVVSMTYYGLSLNVGNLDGNIYINFAIVSCVEVAATLLVTFLLTKIGRKPIHACSFIIGGLACVSTIFSVLYADESLYWITVALANVGKFGITGAFITAYIWSGDLFPTVVRNSGVGSCSMMARVGGMICPYIADLGNLVEGDLKTALPLIVFGALALAAGISSLFLPETRGSVLPETIDDAEQFGRKESKLPLDTKYILNVSNASVFNSKECDLESDNSAFKSEHL